VSPDVLAALAYDLGPHLSAVVLLDAAVVGSVLAAVLSWMTATPADPATPRPERVRRHRHRARR
jgi:hypothetical protein